jgi:hypothetical protein
VAKDFYSVIMRAVLALEPNTQAGRRGTYDRARRAVLDSPAAGLNDLHTVEVAIKLVEQEVKQLLSSKEFNQGRPLTDGTGEIKRLTSKWKQILVPIFKSVALSFTIFGVMAGVGVGTPVPLVEASHGLNVKENTQVNHEYEIGRSADPPETPTPLGNEPRRAGRESEERSRNDRLLSLQELVGLVRDLRFKLIRNSELLDRLDNLLDAIAKSADSLIDDRKLIEQMFDLAQALADIEETKDKIENEQEISDALRAIESVVAFANTPY